MPYKDQEKQREFQRDWIARRRARYEEGQVCANCGRSDDLEIHHRDMDEKVSHRIWSWATHRLEAELAKCDWWCDPCHNELHSAERRVPCGTNSSYDRGCRCGECRTAHAAYARAWRAERRILTA